jgi:hypothetical protein
VYEAPNWTMPNQKALNWTMQSQTKACINKTWTIPQIESHKKSHELSLFKKYILILVLSFFSILCDWANSVKCLIDCGWTTLD